MLSFPSLALTEVGLEIKAIGSGFRAGPRNLRAPGVECTTARSVGHAKRWLAIADAHMAPSSNRPGVDLVDIYLR